MIWIYSRDRTRLGYKSERCKMWKGTHIPPSTQLKCVFGSNQLHFLNYLKNCLKTTFATKSDRMIILHQWFIIHFFVIFFIPMTDSDYQIHSWLTYSLTMPYVSNQFFPCRTNWSITKMFNHLKKKIQM